MANFSALKTAIQNAIKQNGNNEITGDLLQQILLSVVNTMGDGAINTIEQNLSQEATTRQGADNALQSNINAEAQARGDADTQLQNAINAINTYLAKGYVFAGVATPTGTPESGRVFYVATTAGRYTSFGNLQVQNGISILLVENGSWTLHQLLVVNLSLAQDSNNPVSGGAVYQAVQHEKTERQEADAQLQNNINNEKGRAVGAENGLHQEIVGETDARRQEIQGMRDDVLDLIHEYRPIVIEGNVVNAPDEEDITQQPNNLLKFKDKDYNPTIFSGLGRKYLRKNIIINEDYTSFDGFEMNPEADAMLEGQPNSIFWDRLRERFIAEKDDVYYLDWQGSGDYIPASADKIYVNENIPYFWNGDDLAVDDDVIERYGNRLNQDMINQPNTIYIIQYDFDLGGETITVPENCVLEFDGGSLSNGALDVSISNIDTLYSSWFSDDDTLIKTINFCSHKTLVIDEDRVLSKTLSNDVTINNKLVGLTIRGLDASSVVDAVEPKYRLTVFDAPVIDLIGRNIIIQDLVLLQQHSNTDAHYDYTVKLETCDTWPSDLDSQIINVTIKGNGGGGIRTVGRGLYVRNCMFTEISAGDNSYLFSAIELVPRWNGVEMPNWAQTKEHNARAYRIESNRLHTSNGYFVTLSKNEDTPDMIFNGVQIINNHLDVGGRLFNAQAYNRGTIISNNIAINMRANDECPSIRLRYATDITISCNSFIIPLIFIGAYYTNMSRCMIDNANNDAEIENVNIIGNQLFTQNGYFYINNPTNELVIKNINISYNEFQDRSFNTNTQNKGIVNFVKSTIIGLNIIGNFVNSEGYSFIPYCVYNNSSAGNRGSIKHCNIKNNIGFKNFIRYSTASGWPNSSDINIDLTSLNYSDFLSENAVASGVKPGYILYDDSDDKGRRIVINTVERGFVDAQGFKYDSLRGTTEERPTGLPNDWRGIGYCYFDTTLNKPIWFTGRVWVDATGATV